MKTPIDDPEDLAEIRVACANEDAATEYMERQRWGDTPRCPRALCHSADVYKMVGRDGRRELHRRWRCRSCKRMFSVKAGTVMEDSRLPVKAWVYAFWRAAASKNGCAALELQRDLGIHYRSALFLLNRIREAMSDWKDPERETLKGTVEADETFMGGKPRLSERGKRARGRGNKAKQPVVGMVERGGRLRMSPIRNVSGKNLRDALRDNVDAAARLMTDDWRAYRPFGRTMGGGHQWVAHSRGEYVRGDVYTNTIESAFSLLKRGITGTYHAVSRKHLHRYCDEFAFRWTMRGATDLLRARAAIRKGVGKRVTLAEIVQGDSAREAG